MDKKVFSNQVMPREKLISQGVDGLNDAELLAVLLRTGYKGKNAVAIAQRLLRQYGGLPQLLNQNWHTLAAGKGVGTTRALTLMAAVALAQRAKLDEPASNLNHPQLIAQMVGDLVNKKQEHLVGLYLNGRYQLIHRQTLGIGTLTASLIHPREVFAPALEHRAAAVILVHNHPSGSSQPSPEDIEATQRVVDAGDLLDIPVIDHVIVAKHNWTSLKSEQLI